MTNLNLHDLTKAELIELIESMQAKAKTAKANRYDNSAKMWETLKMLKQHQPIGRQDLADLIGSTANSVSSYFAELRKRGYDVVQTHRNGDKLFLLLSEPTDSAE